MASVFLACVNSFRSRQIWTLVSGTTAAQVITIAAAPLLARLYTPEDFGVWAIFVGVCAVLVVVSEGRYDIAIPLPHRARPASALFQLAVALNFVTTAAIALFAMAMVALPAITLSSLFLLVPISVLIGGYAQALSAWCNRTRTYHAIKRSRIAQSSVMAISAIALGMFSLGVPGLVWSTIAAQIAGVLALYTARPASTPNVAKLSLIRASTVARRFKDFPLYSLPEALVGTLLQNLPALLLAALFSTHAAGSYALAYRLAMLPVMILGSAVGQVFLVDFARLTLPSERRQALASAWKTSLLISFGPALLLFGFGEWIFVVAFGEPWALSGQMSQFMAISLVALFVSACTSGAHVVLRIQNVSLMFGVTALLVKFGILYVAALYENLLTAILCIAVYDIAQTVLINVVAWKTLGIPRDVTVPSETLKERSSS